ncbi:cupredoxin domain-containing protein [Rhodohalobacter sp. 8-1]|uniref:cupredoxin domain-containing protein n=1 Tax=Rhodohalobacter sp. 8-1 TaxID=3131972 RepID=UPI0030ED7B14
MKDEAIHIILFLLFITVLPLPGLGYEQPVDIKPDTLTVHVLGTAEDSRFEPKSIRVKPGETVRFEVKEGMHTVTAYHPDNRRDLRIPKDAPSFDSGILTAGDTWYLNITYSGEYNYFCMPHERMGHVGKIISNNTNSNNTSTNYKN